jgi:DNA-binding NtrC family response regulator
MVENARILVVDDEDSIRKVLKTILEEKGYCVDTAESGEEAISKSKNSVYNLALIDVRLPDIEGTELLKAIEETTPNMVKVIVTGYPSLQNAITAVNNGADAYILKPFKVEKVLQTIEAHLKRQESEREYSEEKVAEFIATRVKEIEETIH